MTHPLQDYLGASGDSLSAFAERVGLSRRTLSRIISGERAPQPDIARRIVEATGGSVSFGSFYGDGLADLASRRSTEEGLDQRLLAPVLRHVLKSLADPKAALSDDMIVAAVDAVSNTHDALARVTTRRGADRLVQALRPVLEEIRKDFPELALPRDRLDDAAALAGALYLEALQLRDR